MREITLEELGRNLSAAMDVAQKERVVVLRKGKPSAILLGLEYKDAEDYAWERDAEFWRMIHERRNRKTIPLAEVKKRLGLSEASPRRNGRTKKRTAKS